MLRQHHAVHPGIVHFPIAFWTSVTILDVINVFVVSNDLWRTSYYLLLAGNVTAIFAVLAGIFEFNKVKGISAWKTLEVHVMYMLLSLVVFGCSLYFKLQYENVGETRLIEAFFSLGGFILLVIGGYHGASLVYKHKIGTYD